MARFLKISAWIQQNHEGCLLMVWCVFPLSLAFTTIELSAQIQLTALAVISGALLYAKLLRKRALRVPSTEKLWLMVFASCVSGLLLSMTWRQWSFSVLCWVLPLVIWAVAMERRCRYQIARERIQHRRDQQARWRESKKAVLTEWKARLRWIAGVQHDMRQPLHALGLLVGHPALETQVSKGPARQVVKQMMSCQRWLHELAENMLEATRLELGEQREKKIESVSSGELCHSIETWISQLAESKGLQFSVQVQELMIYTDVRRLKRVLGNLVFNAVEHTHEGQVELKYTRRGGVHQFLVIDTGPGFDESSLLGGAAEEVSSFGSDLPKTGIGLYVVRKLCEEMNWNLSVSRGVEQGTVFELELADRITPKMDKPDTHSLNLGTNCGCPSQ